MINSNSLEIPKHFISTGWKQALVYLFSFTRQFVLRKHHAAAKETGQYKENVTQNNLRDSVKEDT